MTLVALVAVVPSATRAQSAPGLTAGYAFNEASGTSAADASGGGLTGTLTNGATWGTGRNAGALLLDGVNDFVELGNPASLQLTGSMTVSAWVNSAAFPGDDAAIVSKRASNEVGYQLDTTVDRGPRTVGFKLTNSSGGTMFRYGATTLQANTWYFVTGVYDGATSALHVYLNGQPDDGTLLGTVTATQQNSTANVNIGRRPTGSTFNFNGRIDDVRIYARALTQAEIQADMNAPVAGVAGDTVAPSVAITSPAANAQVTGILNVTAIASDNVGIVGVQFMVDGVNAGVEDTASPYALAWDSRTVANGAHTLTARARDAVGNSTLSAAVAVNVANASSFQNEVLATGFNLPTSMLFLPDGRMLVTELPGTIRVLSPPYTSVSPTPFLQLTNVGNDGYAGLQQGIFSIALDPSFATNHFYYLFYTTRTPNRDRLSRFTADATLTTTNLNTEVVLYQDPQDANTEHHGGGIAFGNDGKLYFTTGEHFQGTPAQDLTSPRGKIHRINPDGTVPTDNPFYDGNGPNVDSIWALGLRNPYRVYYDAPTGRLFVGDVGGNDPATAREEVNLGSAGANYGWPNSEGPCASPCKSPLYSYAHNGRDASITGGFVYHGTQYPSSYQGSYFFADYAQNWIKRLTFDANGNVSGVFNFEPLNGSPDGPYGDIVYLTEGPDGALYYIDLGYSDTSGTFGVSKLRRIRFSSGNQAPIAVGSATPSSGPAPLAVNFSSAGSSDPEGQTLTYAWTFGDGGTSTAANPSHTYLQPGQYSARLSVSDGVNTTISTPIAVSAGSPPTATILAPTDGATFRAGDVIPFSGDATDPDDGTLPASAYTWTIDFLHDGHVHPGAAQSGIKSGTFTIPISGHDFSGNTRYRITLTVTDSNGLTNTRSVLIFPRKVNLSFSTAPAGLTVYVDGIAKTTPFVYDTLIGFSHTVEARSQASGGTSYTFGSWSDGGAQTHAIVVPAVDQSYVATFQASAAPPAIAAWAFNEGSGTSAADASGGGLTGTLTNGAAWGTGRNAGAVSLDGVDDFVELGNPARLQLTGSMTVSAWVNSAAFPGDDAAIVSKRGTSVGYQLDTTVDRGPRTIGFKLTNSSGGDMFRYGATAMQANSWYFVTGVYDAATSTLHVYLNGQLDDGTLLGTVTAAQQNSTANVNVGRRPGVNSFNHNGRIDDVRIYSRALSQAEIQADMNAPVGGNPGETTPPSVTITAPAANAQVSDILNVTAIASDNVGVVGVQFLVDGVNAGVEDTASPYALAWDTRTVANGAHTLTARARDAAGNSTLSAPVPVNVANGGPPTATILAPSDGALFRGGDVISFSGDASDPDDGTLPASAYTWTIDFLHDGHVHPGTPISGVKSGTFTIPTSGHDFSGNTRYRITLTVTDSNGLTNTRSVLIFPRKVNLSFSSAPTGLTLYLDGVAKTTPFVYDTLIGFSHSVEARNQASGGTSYTFGSWSDGGAQTHAIVVPAVDQSYVATFQASAAPPVIAAWAFNEASGTSAADASGGGLTGTLTNGATWGTGRNASALLLDGVNDFVELGNPARLQLTGSMTVSAWVNSAAFPRDDAAIVSKRTSSKIGYQLDTTVDRGPRTVAFKLTNSSGGSMVRYGATTLQANTWYFVTGVYDAVTSALHVYLNGQLNDGTLVGTVTATQQNSTANVNIGRRPGGSGSFNLNGRIDDVRIYSRALTPAEIQADMNTPVG